MKAAIDFLPFPVTSPSPASQGKPQPISATVRSAHFLIAPRGLEASGQLRPMAAPLRGLSPAPLAVWPAPGRHRPSVAAATATRQVVSNPRAALFEIQSNFFAFN